MTLEAEPEQQAPRLVQRLVRDHAARWVSEHELAALVDAPASVLFVVGDVVRHPEGLDVAVVLPELLRGLPEPIALGIARPAEAEALAARFGVRSEPALLFFRAGEFLAAITGMHDWSVFVEKVRDALSAAPQRARHGLPMLAGAPNCR